MLTLKSCFNRKILATPLAAGILKSVSEKIKICTIYTFEYFNANEY